VCNGDYCRCTVAGWQGAPALPRHFRALGLESCFTCSHLPQDGRLRDQFQRELLEHWSQLEPRAALAASLTLKSGSWGRDAVGLVLGNWSAKEPEAALAWVRQSSSASLLGPRLAQVLPQVARTDPRAALAAVSEIESKGSRQAALARVVKEWAAKDPAAAAGYLTNFPPRQRPGFIKSIAEAWARQNPEAAVEWAQSRTDESERMNALSGAFAALAETAPTRAAALFSGLEGTKADLRAFNVNDLSRKWAASDLAAASDWAKGLSDASLRAAAVSGVLEHWLELDPRGAADFAVSVRDGAEQLNSPLAWRHTFGPGLPLSHDERLGAIVSAWSQRDWQAASDWVNQLPAGGARDAALKGLCQGLAASQPEKAAAFVASMPPGSAQSEAAADVVNRWAQQDPKATAQWVRAFPEGQARERAAGNLIITWALVARQPAEAAQWLQTEPAGSARDRLAQNFVNIMEDTRPDLAAPWVNAFTDEAMRQDHVEQIARAWLARDPDAARRWLQETPLPDEKKQRLLAK
jgi:hypothetical protein